MWYKNILTKGVITFMFLTFFCLNINAQQVRISVNIPPPYPIHLEDYFSFDSRAVVTLTNMGNTTLNLKLITSVTDNQGIEGHVKDSWNPLLPITLNPMEVKVLSGVQMQDHFSNLTENDASIVGIDVNQVIRTETLPEGMYQVCVKALDVSNNQLLSDDSGCTYIFLTNYDPPIILAPSNEANVAKQTPQFVNFTWTPSGMAGITRYRLQLVDMTAIGLFNPNDAFGGQFQIQPFYEKENLIATVYPYSIADPQLEIGHQYAVRVTAYDPQNTLAFKNEGKSEIITFTYTIPQLIWVDPNDNNNFPPNNQDLDFNSNANNDDVIDPPNGACVSNTKYDGQFSADKNVMGNGTDILAGHFVVKNTIFTKNSGGVFNGTGTIKVNFLNTLMKVEFTGIKVDNNNRLKAGKITGKVTSNNIINSQMATVKEGVMDNLPNAQGLYDKLQEGNRLVSQLSPENAMDLPISWDSDKYNVGIVGLIFESTEAYLNAVLPIDVPQAMNGEWLNISTKGIKIHPNGFGDAEIKINLAADKSLPLSNTVSLMIKGGDEETYVSLDCDGFHSLNIKGAFVLSRDIALPLDGNYTVIGDENVKVNVPFELNGGTDFEDFLLSELALSHPFSVPDAPDFVMETAAVSFDFSSSKNSNAFKNAFPNKGNDWIGLYMKSLKLTLPKGFKKEGGSVIKVDISEFMVDKMGVTGDFAAESAPLAKGSIAGWNFDLAKVDVQIKNSKLTGGGLGGSINIPLGKKANFGFWAKIQKGNSQGANYEFDLETKDEIEADLFIANIKLFEGSKINLVKNKGKFEASTELHGEISIKFSKNEGNSPNNSNVSNFDLPKLKFEELIITGKDTPNFVPDFDLNFFALENQGGIQAKLGFFELGLDELAFGKGANNKVGLTIGMSISLFGGEGEQSTGVSGATEFTLWAKYDKPQKTFAYNNAQLKSIELQGDIGVAYVGGSIDIFSQDETFGNGFRGSAQIEVTGINLGIDVSLQFGRTLANKGNYKYWYFDVMAKFPNPGINIPSTAASIYGIGGGAWCNMNRSGGIAKGESIPPDQYNAGKSGEEGAPTVSGVTYTPKKGKAGFNASVLFGITGSQSAFNGDLNFSMQLNSKTLAVDYIRFDGTGYVMQSVNTKPRDQASSLIKIDALLDINVANRVLYGSFGIDIDVYNMVTGSGAIAMKFKLPQKDGNGKVIQEEGLKWFIKVGYWTPGYNIFEDPNRLTAEIGFDKNAIKADLIFKGYMMAGNDLEKGLPPLPTYIYDLVKDKGYTPTTLPASASDVNNLAFAFGAGLKLEVDFDFKIIYADMKIEGAFDVVLADLNAKCDGEEIGFHGWYAKGQAYAYLEGEGGIFGVPLVTLKAGAVLDVELPNPTWVSGTAVMYIDIAGHDAGDYKGHFEKGERCNNIEIDFDPFDNAKLVKKITPEHKAIEIDPVNPNLKVDFYYSNKPISILNPYTNQNELYGMGRKIKLLDKNGKKVDCDFLHSSDYKHYTISPKEDLLPNSEYHIIVQAYIVAAGKDVYEIEENYDIKFTTGNLPFYFTPADLVYSNPLPRQRYFMKQALIGGGAAQGVLKAKKSMCYLFGDPNKEKPYVRISNLKTKKKFDVPCICQGKLVTFDIPQGLKNETLYELNIILKKTSGGQEPGQNQNAQLAADSKPKTIFRGLYFKTSKYNNMTQKLTDVKVAKVGYIPEYYKYTTYSYSASDNVKTPVILLEVEEPFEAYDVKLFNDIGFYGNGGYGLHVSPIPYSTGNVGKMGKWLSQVMKKHRLFNTLSNADKQYLNNILSDSPYQNVYKIQRAEGYPYDGKKSYAFSYKEMFRWMENYSYYEQILKNKGYLNVNESLMRPKSALSFAEINAAKNSGGNNNMNQNLPLQVNNGGNGLNNNFPLNINAKSYFPIMNFAPQVTTKDKLIFNIQILKEAKLQGKFNKAVQILNKLGLPTFPKGIYQFHLKVNEPGEGGAVNSKKKTYNYLITEN